MPARDKIVFVAKVALRILQLVNFPLHLNKLEIDSYTTDMRLLKITNLAIACTQISLH